LDSKSIGDTIAWSPYAVEFSKKHNCKVILSTFHNEWFRGLPEYENIDFLNPGDEVGCYAHYKIGWFRSPEGKWDKYDMYPNQVNTIPLQQTATDILGLDYKEVNHGIKFTTKERPIRSKYVVFGPQATSGCKEWTYDNWVTLSKMFRDINYKVVILSSSEYKISQTQNIVSQSWDTVANYLQHAEVFIGLGSGLSWFNWGLNKHTYMINGFAEEGHEFTNNMTKISNNLCIKCWNDPVFSFDAGDWHWCPVYKGTERQHICQRSITPLQVFNSITL
jgi:autotransporter strand-loop-strand O-heptosyltransferase